MCGIAGYFAPNKKLGFGAAVAVASLAKAMEERGDHSWGCTDGSNVQKAVGPISKRFVVPRRLPANFVLHTRWATQGKVKEANSHPFTALGNTRVIGVHNGIISNHDRLNTVYERHLRVDSQHIFQHIAENRSLDDLEGYGTIVYLQGGEWHIGTFNGGELAIADTGNGIFFASTYSALDDALRIGGLTGRDVQLKDNTIYKFTDRGFEIAYEVNIGYTTRKWNDYVFQCGNCQKDLPKGNFADFCDECDTSGVTIRTLCAECNEPIGPDGDRDLCGDCLEEYVGEDWVLETVPENTAIPCEFCRTMVESGEKIARDGNDYVCTDCLVGMSEPVRPEMCDYCDKLQDFDDGCCVVCGNHRAMTSIERLTR